MNRHLKEVREQLWRRKIPQKELEGGPGGSQNCTWYNIKSKQARMTGAEGPKGLLREVKGERVGGSRS